MNASYYRITLDVKSIQSQVTIPVKQGDTKRGICISLVDGGKPYNIEKNCFAVFKGEKPDGTEVGDNCTIEKNRIIYPISLQAVTSPGIVKCEVSLYDAEDALITSPKFTLIVDKRAVGSNEYTSSNSYRVLENYLSEVAAAEGDRQLAEEERQAIWNTTLDSPNVWELNSGMYRVSGFVAFDKEGLGFAVYDNSPLIITKDGDKTIFYLYLGGCGELPYDIITGSTDGNTCERFGIESDRKKDTIIDRHATHEGYPSTLAVFNYVDKATKELKERSNDINVKDFGAVGDGVTDDTKAIKSAFATLKDYGSIILPKGHYIIKPTVNRQSLIKLTGLKGVTIDLNGSTIEVATNGYPNYNLFELIDCENFVITNGTLKGDRLTHDYTTISGTHGFGYGVFLRSSLTSEEEPSDTLKCGGEISNCDIHNFTGDAIVTKNGLSPATITIRGCELHHCRRQGISILDSDTVIIDDCHIHHIGEFDGISGVTGTSPMCGIDIEAISGTKTVNLVNVKNTVIENVSQYAIVAVTSKTYETIDGVSTMTRINGNIIKKILIENCRTDVLVIECNKTFGIGEAEEFTDVLVNNCILNHTVAMMKYKPFNLTGATIKDSIINTDNEFDYTGKELFSSGSTHTVKARCYITGCTLNLSEQAIVRWVELINTTVNGGVLKINEGKDIVKAVSTVMDCTNVNFNGCSFNIMNLYGWYKFIGCSFKDCVPFETSKPLKLYNCYLDSKYVPGANYVNCIIEDEIGAEA